MRRNYRVEGKKVGRKYLAPEEWKVCIKDRHPAYISWERYENNQKRLRENDTRGAVRGGPVRGGSALLPGIIWCAHCGRRLSPHYPKTAHPMYFCGRHHTVANAEPCYSSIRCATLDDFVTEKLLETLAPAGVEVEVHDNTERVNVRLYWSGGFESVHQIRRTVMKFSQLEDYEQLIDRVLTLTLEGKRCPQVASILEREGFRSPRSDTRISSMMVQKLLLEHPRCREQLTNPSPAQDQWRSADLAKELGIAERKLKHWVTRGWATAIQRPHGSRTGQGSPSPPEALRTPSIPPEIR